MIPENNRPRTISVSEVEKFEAAGVCSLAIS